MTKKWFIFLFIGIIILLSAFYNFPQLKVSANKEIRSFITATVKISVCGNGIIEGGENCEGDNLNNQTCLSLGYGPGNLTCDIACSFDTFNCSPLPTSTPTPISTPTPTPTPTPILAVTATPAPAATSTPSPKKAKSISPTLFLTPIQPSPTPKPTLPFSLSSFDVNQSGKIELTEIFGAVKIWVKEWRQDLLEEISREEGTALSKKERKCDLNRDYKCNLIDFSILMSYVEK